jgi:hypothetical protein
MHIGRDLKQSGKRLAGKTRSSAAWKKGRNGHSGKHVVRLYYIVEKAYMY